MKRIGIAAIIVLLASAFSMAKADQPERIKLQAPETKERLPDDVMERLVARPISLVRAARLTDAQDEFEALIRAARTTHGKRSVEEADLLTSFGVLLYTEGLYEDDLLLKRASLDYLQRAIPAYKAAFGQDHPEVAVALNSYADVELALNGDKPTPSAESALEQAYAIRAAALGPANRETLANQVKLAELRGHPSRVQGDPTRLRAAANAFEILIRDAPNEASAGTESAPMLRFALARMYAANRAGAKAMEEADAALASMKSWPAGQQCSATLEFLRLASLLQENGSPELAKTISGKHNLLELLSCAARNSNAKPMP